MSALTCIQGLGISFFFYLDVFNFRIKIFIIFLEDVKMSSYQVCHYGFWAPQIPEQHTDSGPSLYNR